MLQAINVRKSYNTLEVLKGIDLTIEKSEIVSIVGSSGAGKSTLLSVVSAAKPKIATWSAAPTTSPRK